MTHTATSASGSSRGHEAKLASTSGPDRGRHEAYETDIVSRGWTTAGIVAAAFGGGLFTLLCWFVLKQTHLPAFGGSYVSRAVGNAGTIAVLIVTMVLVYFWLRDEHNSGNTSAADVSESHDAHTSRNPDDARTTTSRDADATPRKRPRWRAWLTYVVCYLSPAALVVTTIGIPLAATKLYLDGVTVDQGFRTEYLTRMTDSMQLKDMSYIDMPPYYPAGWFWLGGRFANLIGLPGWEAFQPWALVSISAAACMLVPVWQRLCGSLPVATGIALVNVCVVLVMSAEEPYAAIIALGTPAATIVAGRAVRGSVYSMAGAILFLGASASMYTLYTAAIALSVVVVAAVLAAGAHRTLMPLLHLLTVGVGSIAVAAIVWGPYVMAVYRGRPQSGATAMHYLPNEGTQIPMPMLSFSVIGALCMCGLVYLVVRAVDRDVRAMGAALVVFYGWIVASMVATLTGNTLLGFRLDALIAMQLATAGVLALAEIRLVGVARLYPRLVGRSRGRTVTLVMVILLGFGGLSYAQTISNRNHDAIDLAYTDTDGNGERADRFPADSGAHYAEIDRVIQKDGYVPRETVVLTDERNFMAFYPYHGFQSFTSHYANPLGEFSMRNHVIEEWATQSWTSLADPRRFRESLDESGKQWRSPDVFIFTGDVDDKSKGWMYDIAEDIYPNNPNVRFRGVWFNPAVFLNSPEHWNVTQVGPFVVVTRINHGS